VVWLRTITGSVANSSSVAVKKVCLAPPKYGR
jgi:hypothetical protein